MTNNRERLRSQPPITPAALRKIEIVRDPIRDEWRLAQRIEIPPTPADYTLWQRLGHYGEIAWALVRLTPTIISVSTQYLGARVMKKDTRSTIAGIVRTIIIGLVTVFAADKVADATGVAEVIVTAIMSVWALVELIVGWFNNKEPKTEG